MTDWPKYESHKIVQAKRIVEVHAHPDGLVFTEDGRFEPNESAMARKASVGDYAVIYADGYRSISPAQVFEDGYVRLP